MYGQKQIFQCLAVIILITILNFYRSTIRRDKEIQKSLKAKREQQNKVQIDASQVVEMLPKQFNGDESESIDKWKQQQCNANECKAGIANQFMDGDSVDKNANNDDCANNENTCSMTDQTHSSAIQSSNAECHSNENDSDDNMKATNDDNSNRGRTKNHQKRQRRGKGSTKTGKTKTNKRVFSKTKINGSNIETTGVLTYIVVTILLVSLIKAAVDVSKHICDKRQRNNMDDNELLRRCSLQEYSMVKQQQMQHHLQQQQQQNINSKRKSVSKITELMPQSSVDSGCNNPKIKEQSRRMSTNPQDYLNGSGIVTEPGSPAKPGKLLAGRPAPLLRRCSVPVFGKNPSKLVTRRPSIDSVSEDDNSSPDVKRRVRMINRH